MPTPLTPERLEEAVGTLEEATTALTKTRKDMDEANKRVGSLLDDQRALREAVAKGETTADGRFKKVEDALAGLATKMEGIAEQHTNISDRLRKVSAEVAHSGQAQDKQFEWRDLSGRGAIFQSRQQALELGFFLMATMKRDNNAKSYARRWLKENKDKLRYIPNTTHQMVADLGQQWFETIRKADLSDSRYLRDDLVGGSTPGSVLVRPEFSATLIRNVEEHGKFRRDALIWPMGSDTVHIPRRSGGTTIHWEGEATTVAESDPAFELLGMTAKKWMMLHQHSSELSEDAAISLAGILMFEFALAVATEEDRIGFNGTGAGGDSPGFAGFVGVLGATRNGDTAPVGPFAVTGAAGSNLTTEITIAKLREMTGVLHTWSRQGAKWYVNRTVHADMDGILDGDSGSVVKYNQPGSGSALGYPIEDVEGMPVSPSAASTPVLALGNLRKSWILGDRRQFDLQTSEHFAFNTDQLTVRVTGRISFLMVQGNGMVVYVTGTA